MVIIVTGELRSGTSLMMQTLKSLGVPVVGSPDFRGNSPEEVMEMNPKGFYEIGGVVLRGLQSNDIEFYDGCAIKIICRACMDTAGSGGIGTSRSILDNSIIIWCIRNPRSVAVSQKSLRTNVRVNTGYSFEDVNKVSPASPDRFVKDVGIFYKWLHENESIKNRVLLVNYDDMVYKTKQSIESVCRHLGIPLSESSIESAVNNVDSSMRRSMPLDWDDSQKDVGAVADKLYKGILNDDKGVIKDVDDYLSEKRKERVLWVDSTEYESWIPMRPPLFRNFRVNYKNVREILIRNNRGKKKPTSCENFKYSEKTYTIQRPKDIGPLTRNFICCKGTEVTHEQCLVCWRRKLNDSE